MKNLIEPVVTVQRRPIVAARSMPLGRRGFLKGAVGTGRLIVEVDFAEVDKA